VENRLCRAPGRDDVYILEFRQTFCASPLKEAFLVVFTCDDDLFNDIMTSDVVVDELVGTSPDEWKDIDEQIKTLSFNAARNHLGRRESIEVMPRVVNAADLGAKLGSVVADDRVRVLEYELHEEAGWTYEYFYRVVNRLSDPYYYWMAVNPMFVTKLVIDYRELKPLVGRVSANCILASTDSSHDRELGVYVANVGSLVWPGQGAIIVWRTSESVTTA
jgi:hypothetical protein